MPRYMMLFHEPATSDAEFTEDEMQAMIQRYIDWSEKARAGGYYDGGYKLASEAAREVRRKGDQIEVHDGAFAEAAEMLSGLMIISAADFAEAETRVADHPHLDDPAAWIELKRIDETD